MSEVQVRQREARAVRPESNSVCQLQPCIMRANGLESMDIPVQSTHIRMNRGLFSSVLCTVYVCKEYVYVIRVGELLICTAVYFSLSFLYQRFTPVFLLLLTGYFFCVFVYVFPRL